MNPNGDLVRTAQVGKKYSQEGILSRFGEDNLRSRKMLNIRVETGHAQELGADTPFTRTERFNRQCAYSDHMQNGKPKHGSYP